MNRSIAFAVAAGLGIAAATAADWPRFRGPDGNSILDDKGFDPAVVAKGQKLWQAEVGRGYSELTVAAGKAYTMGNDGEKDTVWCFDAATGAKAWTHTYPAKPGNYPGPRSSPWIENGKVYTVGYWGDVSCLDAATGKVIWQKNLAQDTGAQVPQWGFATSPMILGDVMYLGIGQSGCAVEKGTGKVIWKSDAAASGYSTPLPFTFRGKPSLAIFGAKALYVVDQAAGKVALKHGWETSYDVNASDPIHDKGRIYVSSGYGTGCALIDINGPQPRELWRNKKIRNHFASTILLDGHLYGCDGNAGSGDLVCLDFATGAEKWRHTVGFGQPIVISGHIVFMNEKGDVIVCKASPAGYTEEARADAIAPGGKAWTAPTYSNGRLYLRNDKGLAVALQAGR